MNYPSWVYTAREDVTKENKRLYDLRYKKYLSAVEEAEKKAGRRLNLRERSEISREYNI